MPIFEYKCNKCGTKYEIFHKAKERTEDIECPSCGSSEHKKLFSSFSSSASRPAPCGSCGPEACESPCGCCGMH